jgi:hypothetical protein
MFNLRNSVTQKGMFLISSYLVLSVVGTFSLALFLKSTTVQRSMLRTQNRIIAFHLADAALDQAIVELENDPNYEGTGYTAFGRGGYTITIETPDADHFPTVRRIVTNGFAPNNVENSFAYQNRQVISYVNLNVGSPFDFGLFGDESVSMGGKAQTDSYNSNLAPYEPGGTNGDVGTNSTEEGAISLDGNAIIGGDAIIGPGGDTTTGVTTGKNTVILGTETTAAAEKVLNPIEIPTNLIDQGDLVVEEQTILSLAGGTYLYSSFSISGQARVNFTGPATIYVTGAMSISGQGVVTSDDLPPNLLFYVSGEEANVAFTGQGKLYGAVYAPNAAISISGNGELFGGVVGKSIAFSGSGNSPFMVHYDEALQAGSAGVGSDAKVELKSWQEA